MTQPNPTPDNNQPDQPDEPEPLPAPEPDTPTTPRYVRCPMLACGRLHEITEL
ncbi:hypothetical protein [Streptomyces sp. BBFR102]|uniref:hypothetical protein n=1 Tax=Streptomyces sp. BBFR102 TaxID=3448171 RepID=UPI003F533D45